MNVRMTLGARSGLVAAGLLLTCAAALAQTDGSGTGSGAGQLGGNGALDSVGHLRNLFAQISTGIDAFAAGNSELAQAGRRTAVTLFGVLLVWGTIKSWILGKGVAQLLPEFIQPVVILGLALWAVDHLGPAVKSSVEALSAVFAATLLLPGGAPTEVDIIDRMAAAGFDIVAASPQATGSDWLSGLNAIAHQSVAFLFRLAAAIVLLVAGAVAAGVMVVAKVQTGLAILFAPVMIPWAMWAPSTFLFNAWLSFLIGGAMQGVMAAAVASLSVQVIDRVVLVAGTMQYSDGTSFVTCCVILLMAVMIGFLFAKVPALASGLVGSASLNLDRWSAVGMATGRGVSTAGQGAVAAGSAAYQFGKGTLQGLGLLGGGRGAGTGARQGAGGSGAGSGAGGGGSSAAGARPASGLAGLAGRGVGAGLNAAARALGAGLPDGGAGPGGKGAAGTKGGAAGGKNAGAGRAFPASPDSAARPVHKPFRPKPGARPVNRPVSRAEAGQP